MRPDTPPPHRPETADYTAREVVPAVPDTTITPQQDAWPSEVGAPDRRSSDRRAIDRRVTAVVEGMSDAFLALDPEWRVSYANREAARLIGVPQDALLGRSHWEQWPHTVGSEVERQYRRAVEQHVAVCFEHHYTHADIWHDIRAYPADDGGLAIFFRDITAQKQLEAERERQARELVAAHDKAMAAETQFRLLVERVREYAVFLMDPDGIITHWGEGARRMKKWEAPEVVGKHLRVLYPDQGRSDDGSAEDHLRHAREQGEYVGEGMRMRRGTEPFQARVLLTALRRGRELVGFAEITQDMTGEREREAALQAAMAAAEAASLAKSQFVANTSHEIRTPLNAVIGYTELLEMGIAGPLGDQQRQYVERIRATSRHLLSLVNDVLDLARIEAGEMRTTRERALITDVVASALQFVEPQATARQIALTNGCPRDGSPTYRGDPERVRQIVTNLLSNAVRFTEKDGRVTVTCGEAARAPAEARPTERGPYVYVRVEDTGAGIAPEHLDRIWEAFVQVDSSHTRKVGGSGLGLTISRHLARVMGGDITVTSEPGLGSSFVLWLPSASTEVVEETEPRAAPPADQDPVEALSEVGAEGGSPALDDLAEGLAGEIERILSMYVGRLRVDPRTPAARELTDSTIEDHGATFLADVFQSLNIVGQDGPGAEETLHDGSVIQRLIALRHGAQRARLGWPARAIEAEYEILREEVRSAVRRVAARLGPVDVARAIAVIDHQLTRAAETSVAAAREPGPNGDAPAA